VGLVEEVEEQPQAGPAGGRQAPVAHGEGGEGAVLFQRRQPGAHRLFGPPDRQRRQALRPEQVRDSGAVGGGVERRHDKDLQ
jgi:hypothetical protein